MVSSDKNPGRHGQPVQKFKVECSLPKKQTTTKEDRDEDEKDEDTSQIQREDSDSSILQACGLSQAKPMNVEQLVFGGTLSKHHVANIEVMLKKHIRYRQDKHYRQVVLVILLI